jgi:predicted acetyltransferase
VPVLVSSASVDDKRLAGCALVRLGDPHRMAEFFVVRTYRRTGVGTAAARDVFGRHPGPWVVRVLPANDGAESFRARAIPVGSGEARDDECIMRSFVVPGAAAPASAG